MAAHPRDWQRRTRGSPPDRWSTATGGAGAPADLTGVIGDPVTLPIASAGLASVGSPCQRRPVVAATPPAFVWFDAGKAQRANPTRARNFRSFARRPALAMRRGERQWRFASGSRPGGMTRVTFDAALKAILSGRPTARTSFGHQPALRSLCEASNGSAPENRWEVGNNAKSGRRVGLGPAGAFGENGPSATNSDVWALEGGVRQESAAVVNPRRGRCRPGGWRRAGGGRHTARPKSGRFEVVVQSVSRTNGGIVADFARPAVHQPRWRTAGRNVDSDWGRRIMARPAAPLPTIRSTKVRSTGTAEPARGSRR
jgi:hypothetical protein